MDELNSCIESLEDKYKKVCEENCKLESVCDKYLRQLEEKIEQLNTIKYKIENGTLIELPCKVGDKVFSVWCGVCQDFTIKADVVWNFTVRDAVYVTTDYIEEGLFGANVFLTKEQAEAKIKELNG